jgi:hypothetical protein
VAFVGDEIAGCAPLETEGAAICSIPTMNQPVEKIFVVARVVLPLYFL